MNLSQSIKKIKEFLFHKKQKALWKREPLKDWKKLFSIFSVVFLIVVLFNIYFMYITNKGKVASTPVLATSTPTLNKNTLKQVVDFYNAREAKLIELKTTKPLSIDPS